VSAPATGGCLCGAVRFEISGDLRGVVVCHCSLCRRAGTYAGAYTWAPHAAVRISGDGSLGTYVDVNGRERRFCRACGSVLFWSVPGEDGVSVSAGALDDDAGLSVVRHVHVEDAAAWEPSHRQG
jgi:hypothetical protein